MDGWVQFNDWQNKLQDLFDLLNNRAKFREIHPNLRCMKKPSLTLNDRSRKTKKFWDN